MIKLATLFWLVLVTATGLAMFAVKYQVQALDDRLSDTKKAVTAQDREFRVLSAEWAYLNRPAALADMNRRFLSLAPIATKQLHSGVADIAMRPPPAPLPEPVVAVAAAPGNAAPNNAAPNNAIANNAVADSAGADSAVRITPLPRRGCRGADCGSHRRRCASPPVRAPGHRCRRPGRSPRGRSTS